MSWLGAIREFAKKGLADDTIDAFNRQRVSSQYTVWSSKQLHASPALFWDDQETSGSGTSSTYSAVSSSTSIAVGASTAGKRVRQSFQRPNYQPGKSQFITITGSGLDTVSGQTKIIGLHDNANEGIYFKSDDGVISVELKTGVTGSTETLTVVQSDWNMDTLDGTGPSRVNIDFSKRQQYIIDFEWLGVGPARFGIRTGGQIDYVHCWDSSNRSINNNSTLPWVSSPNLPIHYSVENDGTAAATSLVCICNAISSEGGVQPIGLTRSLSTSGTHVSAATADTIYAIAGIRLRSDHLGATVELKRISIISEGNGDFEWIIYINPTVAGTFTYSNISNSATQGATGATANTVTGGTSVDCGFAVNSTGASIIVDTLYHIGSAIDGTVDELVLCARPLANNQSIQATMVWSEAG